MNNNFSLQQTSRNRIPGANLKSRQYKLKPKAHFMRMKNENPKLKQSGIANQLSYSSSTLQRYKNDINMLSPYRIQSNNTNKRTKIVSKTNFSSDSHREPDIKRPQMTSNDLKTTQTNAKSNRTNRNFLEARSTNENTEINDDYLDEILQNNNCYMELPMQIISNDKTVRNGTIQD